MKKPYLLQKLLCIISLFFINQSAFSQSKRAETRIDSVMKAYSMAGISVAVVKKGDLIYTHSFGLKNIAGKTPLHDTDLFRIASVSKSFSATSLMQLAEAKKLSLTDDVSKLTGFPVRNPKYPDKVITLKMLMSHTSGLNDTLRNTFTTHHYLPHENVYAMAPAFRYLPADILQNKTKQCRHTANVYQSLTAFRRRPV